MLVNVPRLVTAYFAGTPDPAIAVAARRVRHLGPSRLRLRQRLQRGAYPGDQPGGLPSPQPKRHHGPLFLGMDTHALSEPAFASALEVFAANGVDTMIDEHGGYTPTPVISHAILTYNKNRKSGLADGIVITPSHNPPEDGGFKYNPPNGGPGRYRRDNAGSSAAANEFLEKKLEWCARASRTNAPANRPASTATTTSRPMSPTSPMSSTWTRSARPGVRIGIDPLGGAGVHYWQPIIERYGIAATVVNDAVDPDISLHDRSIGTGRSGWIARRPMPWRGWSRCATNSTSPSPTTPMPTGMAS